MKPTPKMLRAAEEALGDYCRDRNWEKLRVSEMADIAVTVALRTLSDEHHDEPRAMDAMIAPAIAPAQPAPDPDRVPVGQGAFLARRIGESYDDFGRRVDMERRHRREATAVDGSATAALKKALSVWG